VFRKIGLLVVVLLAFFLLFALAPRPNGDVTREQALALVSADLEPLTTQGATVSFLSTRKSSAYGWEIEARIVENQHTCCPRVFKRYYTIAPFGYRPEQLLTDCRPQPPLVCPEEALVAACKDSSVAFLQNPSGCAFLLKEYSPEAAASYCPFFRRQDFEAFVSGLDSSAWVTQWVSGGSIVFVALDANANVLKKSA